MNRVNMVMLVRGRDRLTYQTLQSLIRNTPSELFNLTVINDGDTSYSLLNHILEQPNACILTNHKTKGITGQARNLGIYWAEKYWGKSEYLCLLDNDLYFTPGWLDTLIDVMESTNISLIGGWNHPFLQPKDDTITVFSSKDKHYKLALHDAVAGACQLMRWPTWEKFGPLDAHAVGVGQSEDWKFCQDIIKSGRRVGSVYPRVVLNCGVTNSFAKPSPGADIMIKELQEAKLKYPDLYWE